ncbi:MAG: hypothetical protein OEM82_00115 [Acidobacteriota bacterium]|nr:hypothetical protein [Acidobacteriota bacterium]MDH3529249.1 hypothetical protein [Acidobacteriota bacterium]
MTLSIKISLLFAGIFLLNGMITGVWKYLKIMSSPEHKAPVYVDIAHRASFFYSFASLVIAKLIEYSPFSAGWQVVIVLLPLTYFLLTVVAYVLEGIKDRTDNIFSERNFATTWFMYTLIAAEIGGFALILGGFIYTQFAG